MYTHSVVMFYILYSNKKYNIVALNNMNILFVDSDHQISCRGNTEKSRSLILVKEEKLC